MQTFLEAHKPLECDYDEFRLNYINSLNLHNHTLENLFLYFSLENHIKKGRVHFYYSAVFINDRRRFKWFINDVPDFCDIFDLSLIPDEVKNKTSFYSSTEIRDKRLVKTKFKETVYHLPQIFDTKTYEEKYKNEKRSVIRKKIYNRIEYPFKYLQRPELNFEVQDITETLLPKIETLHKDWCDYKLNDPKTFKMMFSSNRYYRCLQQSFISNHLNQSNWYRRAFFLNGELIAVRQCLIQNDTSYDIGFFGRFWGIPSNMMNYINTLCMSELLERGVIYHNCGNEMDKNLKRFKEHYPTIERFGYKYNFVK